MVRLFGPGEVIVGAIVDGKAGTTTIRVKPATIKTVEIKSISTPLAVGSAIQLEATTRIFNGDPRTGMTISWSSDKPAIATVDAAGVVTGMAQGKATIRPAPAAQRDHDHHRAQEQSARVEPSASDANSARTGDVVHFTAKGTPSNDFTPRWAVSGSGAAIDPDGGFVAEQPGSYIVTASSGNLSAMRFITITPRNAEREIKVVGRAPFRDFQGAEQWIIGNYAYYSTIDDQISGFRHFRSGPSETDRHRESRCPHS